MAQLNLNHFYYFYEVARHGSFTRAARTLMVSQSALSVQIRSLEEEVGGPLFDRRKGGVDLTEVGELAYETAQRVFQDIDQLMSVLRESERKVSGRVSIGTVNSIGIYVLPEVLSRYRAESPDVHVHIDFQEGEGVVDLLVQGRVDFIIVPWNRRYPALQGVSLRHTKMFLVAPPDHPLAGREQVSPRELEQYRFVGYQEGMYTRSMIDSYFKRMSVSIEYTIESANAATIKHMVIAGMGLGIVPEFAVAGELRRGQLARIEVQALRFSQEMMLYSRSNRTPSRSAREFSEFVQSYFRQRPRRAGE
jgi:DNA-binding transcriptional LysR family regulator